MKADGVFELIKDLKDAPGEVQCLGEDILDYIYKIVYRDYFERERELIARTHEANSYGFESALRPLNGLKSNIHYFLDGNDSIITYFHEMVKDNNKEFIDLFIEKSEPFFELIKNEYYERSDFRSVSFTFNLYTMLAAYHFSKDDIERYRTILEDVDFLINCNNFYNSFSLLARKKQVIDLLVSTDIYTSLNCLREELVSVLKDISSGYNYNDEYTKKLKEAVEEIKGFKNDHDDLTNKFPDCLMLDLNSLCSNIIRVKKYNENSIIYYHKYFLLGHRYNFINSEVKKYLSSDFLCKEFNVRVMKMDFTMFNEKSLDEDGEVDFTNNDFFISCLNSVLDSDSFEEVNRKLVALNYATELYRDGKKEEALVLCEKLKTDDYKTVRDGKVVGCNFNSINITDKPKTVGDRMVLAYKKLYPDIENKIAYMMNRALASGLSYSFSTLNENFDSDIVASQNQYEDMVRERERKELEEKARLELAQSNEETVEEPVVVDSSVEVDTKDKVPQKRKIFFKGWN